MDTLFKLELNHAQLVKAAYEWVMKGRWGVAFYEFKTYACNGEIPDVIGFCSGPSVIVECKASRSDFFADRGKMFRQHPEQGMGDWRYYCCPEGLIQKEELPNGWGLLYVNPDYKVKAVHRPMIEVSTEYGIREDHYVFEKNIRAEHGLMYSAQRAAHIACAEKYLTRLKELSGELEAKEKEISTYRELVKAQDAKIALQEKLIETLKQQS